MKLSVKDSRISNFRCTPATRYHSTGFTLIELMIVMVIITVAITFAVPAFNSILEKRQLSSAAEEIASFITFAQSEAIKQNQFVTVSWVSNGHDDEWCVGASLPPQTAPCDCMETDAGQSDYCSIDGSPFRLEHTDFVAEDYELVHWFPQDGDFSFDPVRGIMADLSHSDILSPTKPLVYFHASKDSDDNRKFELELDINIAGRVDICTDDYQKMIVAGYSEC